MDSSTLLYIIGGIVFGIGLGSVLGVVLYRAKMKPEEEKKSEAARLNERSLALARDVSDFTGRDVVSDIAIGVLDEMHNKKGKGR